MKWYKDLFVGESVTGKIKKMEGRTQCRNAAHICDHFSVKQ